MPREFGAIFLTIPQRTLGLPSGSRLTSGGPTVGNGRSNVGPLRRLWSNVGPLRRIWDGFPFMIAYESPEASYRELTLPKDIVR